MSDDDLDALRAALKPAPAPDEGTRARALALAMRNFDGFHSGPQGSADPLRPNQDRPPRAGFLKGVADMLKSLSSRPILAGSASVAALCLGLAVVLPQMDGRLAPPKGPVRTDAPAQGQAGSTGSAPALPGEETAPVADTALSGRQSAAAPADATPARPASTDALAAADPLATEPMPEPAPQARSEAPAEAEAPSAVLPPRPAPGQPLVRKSTGTGVGISGSGRFGLSYDESAMAVAPASPDLAAPALSDTEAYANAEANPVKITAEEPVSTFSIDVDTASYAVVRSSLQSGHLPPADAVRVEEMVNYFPYDYPAPEGDAAFRPTVTVMPTPWNAGTRLVHVAIQGARVEVEHRPALNLVFLVDTSGSMQDTNKLPLLKQSLALMLPELRPEDRVAIVAYAGSAGQVLPPTPASDRATILAALDRLEAGGSTAGAEGIALAYRTAEAMAESGPEGAVGRVLLATDGDFNVGIDDPGDLIGFIAKKRESGTYLSVLGFGRGNLDDATMQALAQNGNGTASYIDTLTEARKVLVDQVAGALFPIADDVKIQIEWSPATVAEYRLIGYETRALKREDFSNDKVDAGEIGAGAAVTAIYEITPPGSPALRNEPLRYAAPATEGTGTGTGDELGLLRLRWKAPGASTSTLVETPIPVTATEVTDDVRFGVAIAGFGQLLRGPAWPGDWGWQDAIALAGSARGADPFGYRAEALSLMRLAEALDR